MVFIPSSISRCDGRDRRVEEDAHPCFRLMYIYTWASIDATSIFKTSTEELSIVLHTSSSNMQSCLVCRLKGKTLLLPYLQGEERPNQLRAVHHCCRALQVENRVQVENRFPSVVIFITIHQPKSFLSP